VVFFLVIPVVLLRDSMFRGAARSGNVGSARVWLALGANMNSGEPYGGMDALHWAIVYGRGDMVEFLLKRKIQFNTNNILDMVPRGHEQIADLLKQYGAVETGRRDRQDAIHCKLPPTQHKFASFGNQ
jgi:ankyrin repeat protein